jgi:hypothetical protein
MTLPFEPFSTSKTYASVTPTLARCARMGHPHSWRCQQKRKGGPPALRILCEGQLRCCRARGVFMFRSPTLQPSRKVSCRSSPFQLPKTYASVIPTLAKCARMGHPHPWRCQQKLRVVGHPPYRYTEKMRRNSGGCLPLHFSLAWFRDHLLRNTGIFREF